MKLEAGKTTTLECTLSRRRCPPRVAATAAPGRARARQRLGRHAGSAAAGRQRPASGSAGGGAGAAAGARAGQGRPDRPTPSRPARRRRSRRRRQDRPDAVDDKTPADARSRRRQAADHDRPSRRRQGRDRRRQDARQAGDEDRRPRPRSRPSRRADAAGDQARRDEAGRRADAKPMPGTGAQGLPRDLRASRPRRSSSTASTPACRRRSRATRCRSRRASTRSRSSSATTSYTFPVTIKAGETETAATRTCSSAAALRRLVRARARVAWPRARRSDRRARGRPC